MKKRMPLVALVMLIVPLAAAQGPHDWGDQNQSQSQVRAGSQNQIQEQGSCGRIDPVSELPYQEIDVDEQDDLVFMREEEKLARDVYRSMDDLWGMRVFRNIAGSEQTHMEALLGILDKYGIADPVVDDQTGAFTNPALLALYGQLIEQGSASILAALIVGATIEDLDIHDLHEALAQTDNLDARTVYQNLMKGSRNHLRSFVGLLTAMGIVYEPQYIDAVEFDEIVNSPRETGAVDANGDPVPGCDRPGRRQNRLHRQ